MESLAYTVMYLLRGSLPWDQESRVEVFHTKQLWSGSDLGFDYPSVFGDFVDYTRKLKFESEPDYADWMKRFRSLAASPEAVQVVGKPHKVVPESSQVSIPELPDMEEPWFTPFEEDYVPPYDMPAARVPTTRDLIGDEKATVRQDLARIEKLPNCGPPCQGEPEYMLSWEQEDHEEEEFGRKFLSDIDKFWKE